MGKYSRLGKNTLLVLVGNAGAKLIGLFMLPFYTSWLSVEEYGTTDIINIYVTFIMQFVSCCIGESIFIFPKGQKHQIQKEYFSSGLSFCILSLCITALVFYLINIFSAFLDTKNSFITNLWFIYGMILSTLLQQLFQQFTRSIDKMKIYSITGIVLTLSTAIFSFCLIPKWGVHGFVLAMIIANICAALFSFCLSGSYKYFSLNAIRKERCIEMLKYSIPLIPNGIMWWLVSSLNRPIMESYLGLHSIGILAVANKFPGILSMFFVISANSWQISVLEEYGKKDFSIFYNKIFRAAVFLLFLIFGGITFCSELLVILFSTEEFYDAWKYIPILTLGTVFSCISGLAGSVFSAVRKSKYYFYSSIWGALVAILINFIFIPRMGILGASSSIALSFFIMALFRIIYSWKYVKLLNISYYLSMMLIFILMILSINLITSWSCVIILFIVGLLINKEIFKNIIITIKNKINL